MLKVDIRNRILKPKVGEIITVIGDIYTTVAETIPYENGRCESCAFNDETKVGGDCGDFVSCSKLNRKDNVMKKVRDFEVFKVVHPITANEVTIQAIPRDTISCNGCAFRKGDLESMCKAYLCFSERTLDCLVFKKVK